MSGQSHSHKRLGFLPDWRVFTYVILVINLVFLAWIIAGAAASSGDATNCGTLSQESCNAAEDVGTALGVGLIVGLWVAADVILGIIWLITRTSKRPCPVCGHAVKKGQMACTACGYDFRAMHAGYRPAQAPAAAMPAGWYPDNADQSQMRWWDGQQWTSTTQPKAHA